jgi:cellulose synthase/poly-beta-1,6-N-acetylglucosamine synthase-like glycosyltransferase
LFTIEENLGMARGKANVLAHLAKKATGAYFFIADADVRPNAHWLVSMLKGFNDSNIGIVNGTTLPIGRGLLQNLQAMDWVLAQGIIRFLHLLGIDYTAVGNNMVISKMAYEATGGYEQIPFSITEDLALYQASHAKGYRLIHLFSKDVLATTVPQHSWASLLSQRVRWMHGAGTLPLWQQTPLFLQMLFVPLLFLLFATGNSAVAILLLGIRWLLFSISWGLLGQWQFLWYLPVFEGYAFLLYWQTVWQFYTGKTVVWKGRTFSGQ